MRTKSVATVVKGRFKDRLHDLEHGLLNPAINHVRDSQASLTSSGFGYPNPADVARPVVSFQQRTTQTGKKEGSELHDLHHNADSRFMPTQFAA
jgi:hypothetical protein